MKALGKLALLVLLVHAMFRFVPPYFRHHQFDSALETAAREWHPLSNDAVIQKVVALAAEHSVPIGPQHVAVSRVVEHLYVDVSYVLPIEWVPKVKRPWTFRSHTDAWVVGAVRTPGRR